MSRSLISSSLRSKLAAVGDLAVRATEQWLPAYCLVCNNPCREPQWVCRDCLSTLTHNTNPCRRCALPLEKFQKSCTSCALTPTPFSRAEVPLLYSGLTRDLIHRWKFEGALELTPFLIRCAGPIPRKATTIDAVVPIPMAWRRRWSRGYNQSELLAYALLAALRRQVSKSIPLVKALSVTGQQRTQHRLSRVDRQSNSQHHYRINRPVAGQRVLLVDDVMTTGATVSAATETLMAAGAVDVQVWCLARTP